MMKKKIDIPRDLYLKRLLSRRENGMVKIISGLRRCGKSYLMNTIFHRSLAEEGVPEERIISIALDDLRNDALLDPRRFYDFVCGRVKGKRMHYLLVDEVQELPQFERVMNSLLHLPNLDVYVTGSNSRFLTSDVVTEFRGRGDEVRVYPLSFEEFYSARKGDWREALQEYFLYGGMPYVLHCRDAEDKRQYLKKLMRETYLRDLIERNQLRRSEELEELVNIVASGIGGLTNPLKLQRSFESVKHLSLTAPTIRHYIELLREAYLVQIVRRFDVKGKRYINSPYKLYFADLGLRNALLNFRQYEPTHAMENVILNELVLRGFEVDVGEVRDAGGSREVDFVINRGSDRCYLQSAWSIPDAAKRTQETRPLRCIRDSFSKLVVVNDDYVSPHRDDDGIIFLSLRDFLLSPDSSPIPLPF